MVIVMVGPGEELLCTVPCTSELSAIAVSRREIIRDERENKMAATYLHIHLIYVAFRYNRPSDRWYLWW